MARDAQAAGDRVACEGFLQYAEHYLRVLNAAQESRNNGSGRAQGNGQDARPDGGQQAMQNTNSANAGGNGGNGSGSGGNGSGNGERPPGPTLGDAGGPVPEMLKSPAEVSGDTDQSPDDMDNDPMETESAVN
jgi:hypothetical protein